MNFLARIRWHEKQIEIHEEAIRNFNEKRVHTLFRNKEYVTDLTPYEGKYFENIRAIDTEGKEVYLDTSELVWVQDGKLQTSSQHGGIMWWSEKHNKYTRLCYFRESLLPDIVGFFDIELEKE